MRHLLLTMLLVLSAPTAKAAERWEMLPPTPAPISADRTGKVDSNGDPLPGSTQRYATKPASAAETLRYMLANGVPYTIAWRAIKQYASLPNSWWKDALKWHAGSESPRGRR